MGNNRLTVMYKLYLLSATVYVVLAAALQPSLTAQTVLGGVIADVARGRAGTSVAASGNLVAVGAPEVDPTGVGRDGGGVTVYECDVQNDDWRRFGPRLIGQAQDEHFGTTVALSGRRLYVGTRVSAFPIYTGVVRAYEYQRGA